MTFSSLVYFAIPKRATNCVVCEKAFEAGNTVVSRIREGKNIYIREDALACCEEALKNKEPDHSWIYWQSIIPKKEKIDLTPKTKIERAFNLLEEWQKIQDKSLIQEQAQYLLVLYLVRKKQLFLKKEQADKQQEIVKQLYERPENGEVFLIPRPELSEQTVAKIQDFIAKRLKGQVSTLSEEQVS